MTPARTSSRKQPLRRARAARPKQRRRRPGGERALLVRLGLFWLALVAVATVAGAYSARALHSTIALDSAIVGGVCSAVVAVIAFASAAGRRP